MADVAFASTGACFSTESLRNGEAPSICERSSSASLRCCLPESLSFEKSLSVRLPFPSLRSHVRLRQAPVQVNAAVGYPASITWWKKGDQPNMREIHSAQEFVEAITKAEDKLVLVDFYSIGCRSCKALHPKICQIAAENPDIDILKVNFYDNNVLCRSLNVNIMPFFHFYRGKEGRIDAFSCSLTKGMGLGLGISWLDLLINKLREAVAKYKKGHLVMPSPGPISPVAKRKDLLVLPTPARATAGSVS